LAEKRNRSVETSLSMTEGLLSLTSTND